MWTVIIEVGVIGLLIVTPLALGGAPPESVLIIALGIGGLWCAWLTQRLAFVYSTGPAAPHLRLGRHHRHNHHEKVSGISPVFMGLVGALLLLIAMQVLPLPAAVVNVISPASYRLYAQAAAMTETPLPALFPVSVCPQATIAEGLKLAGYLAIFFLIINTIHSSNQIRRVIIAILIMGFLEAFYGILQFVSGQNQVYAYRVSYWVHGTFINKNHLAGYLELVIPFAFALLLTRTDQSGRSFYKGQTLEEKYMKGLFVAFSVFLLMCALFLTGSRGGIVSLAVGMVSFGALTAMRRLMQPWIVIVLIVLAVAFGIFVAVSPERLSQRIETLTQLETDPSFQTRLQLWRSAAMIFRDYPIFGSGLGTYGHLNRSYKTFLSNVHYNYPENDYVQFLAETGIVGVSLAVGIAGIFAYHLFKAWRRQESYRLLAIAAGGLSALLSVGVHSLVDFNLHLPANALLFTVSAALSYMAARTQKTRRPSSHDQATGEHPESDDIPPPAKPINPLPIKRHAQIGILLGALMLSMGYTGYAGYTFSALRSYRQAEALLSGSPAPSVSDEQHTVILSALQIAANAVPLHPEYAFMLGKYLARRSHNAEDFQAAEYWLGRAIRGDPANPWYYYESGVLSYHRQDCHHWTTTHPGESWEDCSVTRFFLTALRQAPKDLFLRRAAGQWYAWYDYAGAVSLMREVLVDDAQGFLVGAHSLRAFSKLLYDLQMDYESDQQAAHARDVSPKKASRLTACEPEELSQSLPAGQIELGHDDGSAEWFVRLTDITLRIKKEICLPENIAMYHTAALRIFMTHTEQPFPPIRVMLDDRVLPLEVRPPSQTAAWYELPVPLAALAGKDQITIYIRAQRQIPGGEPLSIGGDQHTPRRDSVFNWETISDLSPEPHQQTGEYLIRLVLK